MRSLFNRHTSCLLAALFPALAAMYCPSAAAAGANDQGTMGGYSAAEDKLLGGPGAAGGYADPYGTDKAAPGKAKGNGAAATGADNMLDNAKPGQTNASFVKPGSVVFKSTRKGKGAAGGQVNAPAVAAGTQQAPVRKTIEIYKSPY